VLCPAVGPSLSTLAPSASAPAPAPSLPAPGSSFTALATPSASAPGPAPSPDPTPAPGSSFTALAAPSAPASAPSIPAPDPSTVSAAPCIPCAVPGSSAGEGSATAIPPAAGIPTAASVTRRCTFCLRRRVVTVMVTAGASEHRPRPILCFRGCHGCSPRQLCWQGLSLSHGSRFPRLRVTAPWALAQGPLHCLAPPPLPFSDPAAVPEHSLLLAPLPQSLPPPPSPPPSPVWHCTVSSGTGDTSLAAKTEHTIPDTGSAFACACDCACACAFDFTCDCACSCAWSCVRSCVGTFRRLYSMLPMPIHRGLPLAPMPPAPKRPP